MNNDIKKKLVKEIWDISGAYSPHEVFSDWVKCCSLSISNTTYAPSKEIWQLREQEYLDTIAKYPEGTAGRFAEMMALLARCYENEICDILGEIYMEGKMGSKSTGQHFTPFNVSEMMIDMTLGLNAESFNGKPVSLADPCAGAGGMLIASAKAFDKAGIDYHKYLIVAAQDIDWRCVYMSYLQLSLLGIKGIIVQGNTLTEPYITEKTDPYNVMYTPALLFAVEDVTWQKTPKGGDLQLSVSVKEYGHRNAEAVHGYRDSTFLRLP